MADEEKPVATAPAGTPININVGGKTEKRTEPEALKEGKRAKREAELGEAREKGANEVLKSLGVKKSERARMLEEIKTGRVKLAEAKQAAAAAEVKAGDAQLEADAFKPLREESEMLRTTLKKYADMEFAALPEALQKTIVEMKVEDPKARLDMIDIFKRSGAIPQTKVEDKAEAKKTETKVSTTMANAGGKESPAGPASNEYERWKQLSTTGQHFLAAQFFNLNRVKILEQRPR